MIDGERIRDAFLDHAHRLLGIALQPQHRREDAPRRDELVVLEADDMRAVRRRHVMGDHALGVLARAGLIADEMQGDPDDPVSDELLVRILSQRAETLRERQRSREVRAVDRAREQAPRRRATDSRRCRIARQRERRSSRPDRRRGPAPWCTSTTGSALRRAACALRGCRRNRWRDAPARVRR